MKDILLIEARPSESDGATATEPGHDGPAKQPGSTLEVRLYSVEVCEHSGPEQPSAEATQLRTATMIATMQEQVLYPRQTYRHWGINE
jgi:hypothetical protein